MSGDQSTVSVIQPTRLLELQTRRRPCKLAERSRLLIAEETNRHEPYLRLI